MKAQLTTTPARGLLFIVLWVLSASPVLAADAQIRLSLEPGQEVLLAQRPSTTYLKITLEGLTPSAPERRPPVNVALVIDRSGSMSGEKLNHAKQAAIMALEHLRDDDIVSVVLYDHNVDILVPATKLRDRQQVEQRIRDVRPGGNTALFAGVSKGAAELRKFLERNRVNRLILLSDGLANVGPSTPEELQRLGRELGSETISVSTIGLGLGYNEDLMVRLAGASDGNHVFAERPEELASVFENEFGSLGSVVAQGITITVECLDGVRPIRILGREGDIRGSQVTARMNQIYGDQEQYLLLEVEVPPGRSGAERPLARVEVRYDDLLNRRSDRLEQTAKVRYSSDAEAVETSQNRGVLISASEQKAAAMDDEALELKDRGDVTGAQDVFRRKAQFLEGEAKKYDSDKLQAQSEMSREAEEAVAAPEPEWNKARKEVREEQYIIRKQQSYR